MRILLITDWNREHGGSERYVAELRDGLVQAGDEVRLLTSSAGDAGGGLADYVAFGSNSPLLQAGLQLHNPFATTAVRRAVADFRPDVALVFMFALHLSPAIFGALGPVRKILAISDYKPICPMSTRLLPNDSLCKFDEGIACLRQGCVGFAHWLRDQPRYLRIRSALDKTDQIITCSHWMAKELGERGVPADCVLLASHPPPESFVRDPAPEPTFLYRGRLDVEKGVDVLVRAFGPLQQEFPTARLDVLGRGPQQGELEELVATLGLSDRVHFHGWKSNDEMWPFLRRAWAQIVPSKWAEPLGLVAVESVLCGVPTIVSKEGGLVDIVRDGVSGLHVENSNENDLQRAMGSIASRKLFPGLEIPGEEIIRVQQQFDWGNHVQEIRRRCQALASDSLN